MSERPAQKRRYGGSFFRLALVLSLFIVLYVAVDAASKCWSTLRYAEEVLLGNGSVTTGIKIPSDGMVHVIEQRVDMNVAGFPGEFQGGGYMYVLANESTYLTETMFPYGESNLSALHLVEVAVCEDMRSAKTYPLLKLILTLVT